MPDSRRITGPHLLLDRPGAVVELAGEDPGPVEALARRGARRLGWSGHTAVRVHRTGATVALEAPPDLLYTACAVLDWAAGGATDALWEEVERERAREENPRLRALLSIEHSPVFSDDDHGFTAGLGRHARTWPLDDLPDEVAPRGRIPFAFVTGTNGKTTTTRMLARIAEAAGHTPGWTSSDAYGVGREVVARGDWTGPGAARAVLRHPAVDFACLETARGGLLRRGLVLAGADAAVVTNVSSDHLGEYGIHDVADMADAKLGVAYGLGPGGTLVVNAGCAPLRRAVPKVLARRSDLRVAWFAGAPVDGVDLDGWADDRRMVVRGASIPLDAVPATFGGTVRHNVENALAAALAARAAGIGAEAVAAGLASFRPTVEESRGRMNRFALPCGATAVVDFAHNPDGVARVGQAVGAWPAARRVVLLGQAGDRTDADLADLAATVAALRPDVVVLKEMPRYLRGRPPGQIPALLRRGLVAAGLSDDAIVHPGDEGDGVRWMLDHARPGDLLLMLIQADLDGALSQLAARGAVPSGG